MPSKFFTVAHDHALSLPATKLTHPFGDSWDVYRVKNKIFLILTVHQGEEMAILKAPPEDGELLREQYPEITPGYHMNKKHWNSVAPGIDIEFLTELITDSYRCVVEGLPKYQQPFPTNQ